MARTRAGTSATAGDVTEDRTHAAGSPGTHDSRVGNPEPGTAPACPAPSPTPPTGCGGGATSTAAALVVGASVYTAHAEAIQESIDPAACLDREVDRVAPGWRVELVDAFIVLAPMSCPRCGTLCVLIEWPARRRCLPGWREINVETLAEGHGSHRGVDASGIAEATVLCRHSHARCDAARGAADLDGLASSRPGRPPIAGWPRPRPHDPVPTAARMLSTRVVMSATTAPDQRWSGRSGPGTRAAARARATCHAARPRWSASWIGP